VVRVRLTVRPTPLGELGGKRRQLVGLLDNLTPVAHPLAFADVAERPRRRAVRTVRGGTLIGHSYYSFGTLGETRQNTGQSFVSSQCVHAK
jgi:hypothetical protein